MQEREVQKMKVYDVFYKESKPLKLIRSGLTEQQMDKFWANAKWWEKQAVMINEREIDNEIEEER